MAKKKITDLPSYMQAAYVGQPSPLAGAQLIFLNELTEMLAELQTSIQAIASNRDTNQSDVGPIMAELSVQIRKSMMELKGAINGNGSKEVSLAPVTKAMGALTKQAGHIGTQQMMSLTREIDRIVASNSEIVEQLKRMAQPKIWEFEIHRDSLDGRPIGVTAKSRIAGGSK